MRVLIVSQYFPPENASTPKSVSQWLVGHGHSVRVLTAFPSYPAGKVYAGYKQTWRLRETIDGADVLRVPTFMDHSARPVRRAFAYASFGMSGATASRFALSADVIYVYATQMSAAFPAWIWSLLFNGPPYVLHIQDLWPDSITGSSIVRPQLRRVVEATLNPWLRHAYKRAAAVIGIAPSMVKTLISRGSPAQTTRLIYNWTSLPDLALRARCPQDGPVIGFAGNTGDMQDLGTAIVAAKAVQQTGLRLVIQGDGLALSALKEQARRIGAHNVDFRPRTPPDDMPDFYRSVDFALISLKDLDVFRGTIPSKFQAAISQGVPVICSVQGDLRQIVEERGLGITCESGDSSSLEGAFRRAAASTLAEKSIWSTAAISAHRSLFARHVSLAAIEEILQDSATKRRKHEAR